MSNKELYQKIKQEVLGYSYYGFLDHSKWKEFQAANFGRSGKVDEDEYSSKVNRQLSGAAMQQTIEEIDKRLMKLFELE